MKAVVEADLDDPSGVRCSAASGARSGRSPAPPASPQARARPPERQLSHRRQLVMGCRDDDDVGFELEQLVDRGAGSAAVSARRARRRASETTSVAPTSSSSARSAAARLSPIRPQPTIATRSPRSTHVYSVE